MVKLYSALKGRSSVCIDVMAIGFLESGTVLPVFHFESGACLLL